MGNSNEVRTGDNLNASVPSFIIDCLNRKWQIPPPFLLSFELTGLDEPVFVLKVNFPV